MSAETEKDRRVPVTGISGLMVGTVASLLNGPGHSHILLVPPSLDPDPCAEHARGQLLPLAFSSVVVPLTDDLLRTVF